MLLNVSYNNPKNTEQIQNAVGPAYTLKERFKMGGIGSPKLEIVQASIQIHNLLILDNNADVCNIEIRPNGILLGFRSLLESYALVIPFYKLTLYKGDLAIYSIHCDTYFVKVKADTKAVQKFFTKLLTLKAEKSPTQLEDL